MALLPQLPHEDVDALLRLWPGAMACSTWRLAGESPSIGLLCEIRGGVDHEVVLRDDAGHAVGLLHVRDVDRPSGTGSLGFLLSPNVAGESPVLPFLAASLRALGLRKIIVQVDHDMLDALTDARRHLAQVGLLRDHTLIGRSRFADRHIYDYTGELSPA